MDFKDDDKQESTTVGHRALSFDDDPGQARSTRPTSVAMKAEVVEEDSGACLIQIYGRDLGRRYDILDKPLRIGRGIQTDICVRDDTASRVHCEVRADGERFILFDLGATNHTYVNDVEVDSHDLQNGDVIRVGSHLFKFLSGVGHEAAYFDEVHRVIQTDSLTGALNRRGFDDEIERRWYAAQRYGRPFSVLMIDIDHFKRVNDTHGHRFGDFVLSRLGQLILDGKRFSDAFCRYGGEEFAFVLSETDLPGALLVATRLCKLIEGTEFRNEEAQMPITVSIGAAAYDKSLASKEALIERADTYLYDAKGSGRNCVRPLHETARSEPV
jgi:diguanylate cyclase (GGDEF)-like protein